MGEAGTTRSIVIDRKGGGAKGRDVPARRVEITAGRLHSNRVEPTEASQKRLQEARDSEKPTLNGAPLDVNSSTVQTTIRDILTTA